MTAREYLDQIRMLDLKITNLIQEKEAIRNSLLPGGVSYREHVQCSPDTDPYGTWVVRMEEKEAEITKEIDSLADLRLEVVRRIWELNDARHTQVLYLRYVQLKKFRDIAAEMGYSPKYISNLHKLAFDEFEKRYNKMWYTCDNEM